MTEQDDREFGVERWAGRARMRSVCETPTDAAAEAASGTAV